MYLKTLAIAAVITFGALSTGCSNACDDLDCGNTACADPNLALDKLVCDALVEEGDGDACDAYTGCGTQ